LRVWSPLRRLPENLFAGNPRLAELFLIMTSLTVPYHDILDS
jgi:hypothetical protein